jgi:hypothetical protein
MTERETLDARVQSLVRELSLPDGDREALLAQVARVLNVVKTLQELPLHGVEPAGMYDLDR